MRKVSLELTLEDAQLIAGSAAYVRASYVAAGNASMAQVYYRLGQAAHAALQRPWPVGTVVRPNGFEVVGYVRPDGELALSSWDGEDTEHWAVAFGGKVDGLRLPPGVLLLCCASCDDAEAKAKDIEGGTVVVGLGLGSPL